MYKILKRAFPQCGSDGRTYQNLCLLNCAKLRCPEQTAGVTARAGECEQADQKQGFHEKTLKSKHSLVNLGREVESELPKVLIKVLFWALLKVLLLGKVPFKVLKKVL